MIHSLLWQAPSAAPSGPPTASPAAPTGSATAAPAAGGIGCLPGAQGGIGSMAIIPLMFVMMYFVMIRPEQKRRKETDSWLKSLKKGDEVVTSGGIIGRISGLTDSTVTLEVQEKVRLKVTRASVTGRAPGATPAAAASEPEKK